MVYLAKSQEHCKICKLIQNLLRMQGLSATLWIDILMQMMFALLDLLFYIKTMSQALVLPVRKVQPSSNFPQYWSWRSFHPCLYITSKAKSPGSCHLREGMSPSNVILYSTTFAATLKIRSDITKIKHILDSKKIPYDDVSVFHDLLPLLTIFY
jgi:hypothetical protein